MDAAPRLSHAERAASSLFESIEVFYDRKRLHSTLDYRSPVNDEARLVS